LGEFPSSRVEGPNSRAEFHEISGTRQLAGFGCRKRVK